MLKLDALRLTCGQPVQYGYHERGRRGWRYSGTGRVVTVNHNGGVLVEDRYGRHWHPYSDVHPGGRGERPERLTGDEDDFV
jgi:hypothetical protein